jgi:ABC-type Fe3+/spermidine/putrescine transport system ATPase subunit
MRQGTIVQVGTAEDLYHRPASSFVAEFIGRVNLIPARVLRRDALGVEVVVAETRLRVAPVAMSPLPSDASFPAPGTTVRLVLRPETLDLVPGPPGPAQEGAIQGVVVSRTFLGEKVEYEVRVGDTSLQVTRYNAAGSDALGPGLPVTLRLPTAGVAMLP